MDDCVHAVLVLSCLTWRGSGLSAWGNLTRSSLEQMEAFYEDKEVAMLMTFQFLIQQVYQSMHP